MTLMPRRSISELTNVVVKSTQNVFSAVDQGDLRAKPAEDPGELDGYVAAALDEDAIWELIEMERLIG